MYNADTFFLALKNIANHLCDIPGGYFSSISIVRTIVHAGSLTMYCIIVNNSGVVCEWMDGLTLRGIVATKSWSELKKI